jgi:myo-inositol-1(or 4)-monophosphatase
MIAFLTENRPDDAIIAEEGSSGSDVPPSSERLTWVLDPIDGTRSYLRQTGSWCTSVGVMHAGFPISGAIFVPQDDKLYAAVKGDRLVVNGNDCERFAPQYPRPGKMVVGIPSTATGVTYDLAHQWLDQHVVRNLGSTALHLVYVATGQFEAALSANSKLWDIAGGACLVEAAGARLTSPRGEDIFPIDVAAYDKDEIATLAAQSRSHGDFIHAR